LILIPSPFPLLLKGNNFQAIRICRLKQSRMQRRHFFPSAIAQNQARLREKIHSARKRITLFEKNIKENTDTLIISYGVTTRAVDDAGKTLEKKGNPVSTLSLKTLWPVPEELLIKTAKPFKRIIVIEMNLGQYINEIRRILCDKKVEFYGQMNGVLIPPAKIMEVVENE